MFCAAIPATAAVAAKVNADQQVKIRAAEENGEDVRTKPVKVVTASLIVLLVAGSVVYHTQFT